jgi:hypothetical protein
MNKQKYTIITECVPCGKNFIYQYFINNLKLFIKIIFNNKSYYGWQYGGHSAVTRSLIYGFKNCNINFNYNPRSLKELSSSVIVLSNFKALKQMINLKKLGYIKKIFAGPNIVDFSPDYNFLITSSEIDLIIVPSEWVRSIYIEDAPFVADKIFVWPAGVDVNYWSPENNNNKSILIYNKKFKKNSLTLKQYIEVLKKLSLKFEIITVDEDNSYTSAQYKHLLQNSKLMIAFSGSESQGIALAEAWSMNVPTLVQRQTHNILHGRKVFVSSAPYLCSSNGVFFNDFDDFKVKLQSCLLNYKKFSARNWVINNMSDEIISKKLYKKIITC